MTGRVARLALSPRSQTLPRHRHLPPPQSRGFFFSSPSARRQAVYACAPFVPRFASASVGPPAQALRELLNPGFPRPSEEGAGLSRGRCLRGARTRRREPIKGHDVSLARSLAAGASSGGSWRLKRVAVRRLPAAARAGLGGDLLGVSLGGAFSSGPDALQLGAAPAAARRPEKR